MIKKILTLIFFSFIVLNCSDDTEDAEVIEKKEENIEEEKKNEDSDLKKEEEIVEVEIDKIQLLNNAYNTLKSREIFDLNGYLYYWGEVGVDNLSIPRFVIGPFADNSYNSSTEKILEFWKAHYNGIAICNNAILEFKKLTENENRDLIAQARFLRAILYFNLVKVFENPVIVSENDSEITPTNSLPTSVYEFIQNDLVYAINNLQKINQNINNATQMAAKAILAKVYVQIAGLQNNTSNLNGQSFRLIPFDKVDEITNEPILTNNIPNSSSEIYEAAITLIDDVLLNGGYSLLESYKDIFDPKRDLENTEMIFKINFIPSANGDGSSFGDTGMGLSSRLPFGAAFRSRTPGIETLFSYYDTASSDNRLFSKTFNSEIFPLPISDGRYTVNFFTYVAGRYNETRDPNDSEKNVSVFTTGVGKWIKGNDATTADSNNRDLDYPYIRLADMYLLKAEALIFLNRNLSEATNLINTIRRRAFGIPSGKNTTDSESVNKIYFDEAFHNAGKEVIALGRGNTTNEEKENSLLQLDNGNEPSNQNDLNILIRHFEKLSLLSTTEVFLGSKEILHEDLPTIRPINGEQRDIELIAAQKVVTSSQLALNNNFNLTTSQQGILEDRISLLENFINKGAYRPLLPEGLNSEELKIKLLQERRKEFAHEGQRKDDT